MRLRSLGLLEACVWLLAGAVANAAAPDPLPGWRDGKTKQTILDFVDQTTHGGSPRFVSVPERIAVFDNDETLVRAAAVRTVRLCARSNQGTRPAAS